MPKLPIGFGFRGGGRKGIAGRMSKIKTGKPKKTKKIKTFGFK